MIPSTYYLLLIIAPPTTHNSRQLCYTPNPPTHQPTNPYRLHSSLPEVKFGLRVQMLQGILGNYEIFSLSFIDQNQHNCGRTKGQKKCNFHILYEYWPGPGAVRCAVPVAPGTRQTNFNLISCQLSTPTLTVVWSAARGGRTAGPVPPGESLWSGSVVLSYSECIHMLMQAVGRLRPKHPLHHHFPPQNRHR